MGSAASAGSRDNVGFPDERCMEIEEQLKKDKAAYEDTVKILLLGPGESGKSTVLKQMRLLHNDNFTEAEIVHQKCVIRGNVKNAMKELLYGMRHLGLCFNNSDRELDAKTVLVDEPEDNSSGAEQISGHVANTIARLWCDSAIREAFSRSNEFQLVDSAKYFLDNVHRISAVAYVPSQEDILMARKQTCGIVEVKFFVKQTQLLVVDVGGQRSQRRKWIHCFQDVNCVLFISAISEYNQMMRETQANRLLDSVQLFGAITNSRWFKDTHTILFLNKIDIFAEKINKVHITSAFPNYTGQQNYEDCLSYISARFLRRNQTATRQIFVHRTCATDTKQIHTILDSCIDGIILQKMRETGFT